MADKKIRIGTRGSALALAQTELVIDELRERYPEYEYEKVILSTKGDRILNVPLVDFGGKGAFVEEFEDRLKNGEIDLAVHSAKDMPVELKEGLVIAGTLKREDVRDVLVCRRDDVGIALVGKIGTGSLRRQLQLKKILPHLECVSIRGNVPTRLKKLDDGEFDGVVLAAAGLKRLGLFDYDRYDYRFFETDEILPAGGQGIIAIEGRRDDAISAMVEQVLDKDTFAELACERTVLNVLQAGCHEAVGIYACVEKMAGVCSEYSNDELAEIEKFDEKSVRHELPGDSYIRLKVMKESGGRLYYEQGVARFQEGKELAEKVAAKLLKKING